ncbi:uncharacterized protein LOC144239673 [Crocuta crocuta]
MEPQRRDREPAAQTLISRRVPQAPVTRSALPTPQAPAQPAQPTPNPRAGSLDATELESGARGFSRGSVPHGDLIAPVTMDRVLTCLMHFLPSICNNPQKRLQHLFEILDSCLRR